MSYEEQQKIPYEKADKLLLLHQVINEEEQEKVEAEKKKAEEQSRIKGRR